MELFNSTGFDEGDKVSVTIDDKEYFGTVVKTDSERNRIKVDYTAKSDDPQKDWFDKKFWKKINI